MIIFGTGGHATELLDELIQLDVKKIYFFNDVNPDLTEFFGFKVLKSLEEINSIAFSQFNFVIGVGNPFIRYEKQVEWMNLGGIPTSVISKNAILGNFKVVLGLGLNIMSGVQISSNVQIGDGCLINRYANLHHGVVLEPFCEVGPNAVLLGSCQIGENSFIGAGAILLPGIKVGRNSIIGAGAVVTNDVPDFTTVKGNPAK